MKALLCPDYGGIDTVRLAELPDPVPSETEALIEVDGAGMNYADLLALEGKYQASPRPPFVPGAEVFGRVVATGAAVTRCRVGDVVMGQVLSGAYAERAVVDPLQMVRVPCPMPAADGAAFFINYGTAYSALFQRGNARRGETLLVLGAGGGVGLAAVQIAHACGLRVIAACRGEAKQKLARDGGADVVLDHSAPGFVEAVKEATGNRGCDLVLDMIGGAASAAALKCIAWCGRIIVIGFAGGPPFAFPANHLLVKNCAVIGHWWGDYHIRDTRQLDEAFARLFSLYADGLLRPHVEECLTIDEVTSGLERYARGTVLGKLVMLNPTAVHRKEQDR